MSAIDISQYSCFSELPLAAFDAQRYSVYVIDLNWDYLFVNEFVCKNLKLAKEALIGQNMWQYFTPLSNDPNFQTMRKRTETGHEVNFITTSPLTSQRIHITGRPLSDCYLFTVSILPRKEDLIHELRHELDKAAGRTTATV